MNTIDELLKSTQYPMAWVQGHHTRILSYDNGTFEVLARDPNNISGRYIVNCYWGTIETKAIVAFIESENAQETPK